MNLLGKLIGCVVMLVLTACGASAQLPPQVTVVATGLDGPRGLKFGPDGALYVAEAGRGGDTLGSSCQQVPSPVGPYHGGPTARISKITSSGEVLTVVDGLPSVSRAYPPGTQRELPM